MEWGTPVWWGRFLLFCVPQSVKTKETNPTRPGSPTPCKQALNLKHAHPLPLRAFPGRFSGREYPQRGIFHQSSVEDTSVITGNNLKKCPIRNNIWTQVEKPFHANFEYIVIHAKRVWRQ